MSIALQPRICSEFFSMIYAPESQPMTDVKNAGEGELVIQAKTGDIAAFEELVKRYRNDVYSLAYHFVRNREEAWDVSQEVFIKAYSALGSFRGDSSFKTWLLRITANRCKDLFKKRRLDTVSYNDLIETPSGAKDESDPSKKLAARETGEAIMSALNTLPAKHRTALVLREFEGMSYDEMSQIMGCNVGTVMSRLFHARKKMQQILIRMGVVEGGKS